MTTLHNAIEEAKKEFLEKFKCIDGSCDGTGSIPHQVAEDEWEAQQCQFCWEIRFPAANFRTEKMEQAYALGEKETATSYGGCTNCYGKGYGTETTFAESRHSRTKLESYIPCPKCNRGKQIVALIGHFKALGMDAGAESAVDFIKEAVKDTGMSEGHDGEEPTGDWIYDLPSQTLEAARTAHKEEIV